MMDLQLMIRDILGSAENVISTSSVFMLALVAVTGIGKGFVMRDLGEIFGRTAQGLLILGALIFVATLFENGGIRISRDVMAPMVERLWRSFTLLTIIELIGYYIWMAAIILLTYVAKTAIRR